MVGYFGILWNIWKTCNQCVFRQGNFDSNKLVQDIKLFAWLWLKNLMSFEVGTFLQYELNIQAYLKVVVRKRGQEKKFVAMSDVTFFVWMMILVAEINIF